MTPNNTKICQRLDFSCALKNNKIGTLETQLRYFTAELSLSMYVDDW